MKRQLAVATMAALTIFAAPAAAVTPLAVTLQSQTATTVTLAWIPPAGAEGYAFKVDGARVSNTQDGTRSTVTFAKANCTAPHVCTVRAFSGLAEGSYPPPVSPPPPAAQVLLAPSGNDTTCARNGTACRTVGRAYQLAQPGDNVSVACGGYGDSSFTSRKPASPNVTFTPVTPFCATIRSLVFTSGGDYSTWRDFNLNATDGAIYQGGSAPSYNVVFDHNHIVVNQVTTEGPINIHSANGWRFVNNTIGPVCCGSNGASPEGIRFGIPTGAPNSTNVLIDNNTVQGTVRNCAYWPATYQLEGQTLPTGPCPGVTCPSCHEDGIHIWGMTDSTISNNRVDGAEVQGIYVEPTNGSLNSNINIIGNTVNVIGGNAGIYVKVNGTDNTGGIWLIAGNQTPNLIEFSGGFTGALPGTVFNLTGNRGQFLVGDAGGNNAGCHPVGNVALNFSGNTWLPVGGGTDGCG